MVEKSNWAGEGALFPRSAYPDVRSLDDFDFNRTGVYMLWEPAGAGDLPRVYIGEADPLRNRLDQHLSQKDFWTNAVAFSAKDQNLNKAHVRHIESRLIGLANEAKRCRLENSNTPRPPSLSPADKTQADAYLSDMMLCLPVLGVDFFEKPEARPETHQELTLRVGETTANGYEQGDGFVVRAGSMARKEETRHIHRYMSKLRRTLVEQEILYAMGDHYEFSADYSFGSPSTAAGVILGRPVNGRTAWKDKDGRTLKQIQEEKIHPD